LVVAGKYVLLQEAEDTKHALTQGPLVHPAVEKKLYIRRGPRAWYRPREVK